MKLWPLRLFLCSIIWVYGRLIHALTNRIFSSNMQFKLRLTPTHTTNWIFSEASATRIISMFQHLVMCQADACTDQLNIQWSFGHSNCSCVLVFDYVLGWCMHPSIEYSVKLRPFRLLLCSSIWLCVRLMHASINWVFSEASATPITPVF